MDFLDYNPKISMIFWIRAISDIEAEVHDVAVLHHVVLTFDPEAAGPFSSSSIRNRVDLPTCLGPISMMALPLNILAATSEYSLRLMDLIAVISRAKILKRLA